MSPRKRPSNVLPFRKIKTRPLPPLNAPPLPPGLGLRVTLGTVDVTKQPAPDESERDPFGLDE